MKIEFVNEDIYGGYINGNIYIKENYYVILYK